MDSLFPLNTFTVVVSGAAVIASTLVRNLFNQQVGVGKDVKLRSQLLYDEAFSVMKAFFEKASLHTVEDIQQFGNNWVPSPFWIRVVSVTIPLSTRLEAGQVLINTIGEDEIQRVVGGREWWQRSANKSGGVTGEWIAMKKDWEGLDAEGESEEGFDKIRVEKLQRMKESAKEHEKQSKKDRKAQEKDSRKDEKAARSDPSSAANGDDDAPDDSTDSDDDAPSAQPRPENDSEEAYTPEMDEMRCLLYIHGGAYFFGSINTHRYSIWRYARKMGGRAFAVHYRLAPQYPFPCALSDALASYIYLIRPPLEAKHKPVDPAKLTLAGDSAGGGLCLALLCLIRDSGLPMPAGAMLISPWCDLTHSFPSILQNTETDILPPYGFLFKPSTLWPPPPPEFQERADESTSLPGLKEAHANKMKSKASHFSLRRANRKGEALAKDVQADSKDPHSGDPKAAERGTKQQAKGEVGKILKVKIDGEEVEVSSQIQLYATNEQLVYPFVSPVWQPSLGGLPPLYIMCGDKEVLRDEIIYMAHRAANPSAYPLRKALLDANPERTAKSAAYPPTKVHLQIYDDACHDLPLMSFTNPAKYCYRAIASFAKFVTSDPDEPTPSPVSSNPVPTGRDERPLPKLPDEDLASLPSPPTTPSGTTTPASYAFLDVPPPSNNGSSNMKRSVSTSTARSRKNTSRQPKPIRNLDETIYTSSQPFNRPPWVDNMVRERVAISGVVRPMEPVAEMTMLHLDPEDIGLVKESPVKRYLAGKAIWDKRFKRAAEHVQKRREHHLKKSMAEEAHRIKKRMKAAARRTPSEVVPEGTPPRTESPEPMEPSEQFEGIWNLHGERPPPSSIAARKDTMEARKLAHVLDEHYSKLHALHLWSDVQDVGAGLHRVPPLREESENLAPATMAPGPPSI